MGELQILCLFINFWARIIVQYLQTFEMNYSLVYRNKNRMYLFSLHMIER